MTGHPIGTGGAVRMPTEAEPHQRCWMAWPARRSIWGNLLPSVREDIARLARAIAEFEQVVMLACPRQVRAAQRMLGHGVQVVPLPVDDLWIRDTGPTFVYDGAQVAGVDFAFNGWGNRQRHRRDRHVARRVLEHAGLARVRSSLVIEQGGLDTDGDGTALATRSCLLNPNRNPALTASEVEQELATVLGIRKVIWLDGAPGLDITDCHVDGLARFTQPGVVAVHQPTRRRPRTGASHQPGTGSPHHRTDARGRRVRTVLLPDSPAAVASTTQPGTTHTTHPKRRSRAPAGWVPAWGWMASV